MTIRSISNKERLPVQEDLGALKVVDDLAPAATLPPGPRSDGPDPLDALDLERIVWDIEYRNAMRHLFAHSG